MATLINQLRIDFPAYRFVVGERLRWNPKTTTISYREQDDEDAISCGLLHELGHAQLKHNHYTSDAELLKHEVAAWERAKDLAQRYQVVIDDEYVEQCLDSYRDWLHSRSTCPTCGAHGLERSHNSYACVNCSADWKVGDNRFCRTYRVGILTK
jgi:hypothetical protein